MNSLSSANSWGRVKGLGSLWDDSLAWGIRGWDGCVSAQSLDLVSNCPKPPQVLKLCWTWKMTFFQVVSFHLRSSNSSPNNPTLNMRNYVNWKDKLTTGLNYLWPNSTLGFIIFNTWFFGWIFFSSPLQNTNTFWYLNTKTFVCKLIALV